METIINQRAAKYLMYTCVVAVPIWLLWIIFDYVFAPNVAHLILPYRIGGSALSLLIIVAIKKNWGSISLIQAIMFAYYNASITYMILIINKDVLDIYFNGYSMIMIVMFFILVLKWIDLFVFASITVLSFCSLFIFSNYSAYDVLGHGGFMFITILGIMTVIGALRYKGILMDVSLAKDIEKSKEIKEMNAVLENTNKEKEVLLKEIHHRVKNNLQVMSSILNLQLNHLSDDNDAKRILQESQHRIKSMAAIHETLYKTSNFASINFLEYLQNLIKDTIEVFTTQSTVELKINPSSEKLHLSIDQALSCGLIINELATNAMKYAFNDREHGTITISLKKVDNMIELCLGDNGVGLPDNFSFEDSETLGIELVHILIEQLDGTISVESVDGTKYTLRFPYLDVSK